MRGRPPPVGAERQLPAGFREGGPRILRPLNGMILQGARLTYIHIQHEHTFFSQALWAHFIRKYLNSSALPARYSWTLINLNG